MNHDLDPRLREKLMDYNRPPEVPRKRMWDAIEARRNKDGAGESHAPRRAEIVRLRRLAWPLAAAALLILGIALGRVSKDSEPIAPNPSPDVVVESPREEFNLYTVAAERYLGRAEILLTRYRSSAERDENLDQFQMWSGQLLLETRLLLDSPAGGNPDTRRLLKDLELVLARMTRLGLDANGDRRILDESLNTGTLMMRLKTRKPAAISPNGA